MVSTIASAVRFAAGLKLPNSLSEAAKVWEDPKLAIFRKLTVTGLVGCGLVRHLMSGLYYY